MLFGRNLQESLCLTTLGPEHLMLMIGGYNSQMHIYTIGGKDDQFTYRFSALGHLNSIKSIAISEELTPGSETRYVASGSQDQYIRVWKIKPLVNLDASAADDTDGEWAKKYETKTSYVLRLTPTRVYNLTLESVIPHHQDAVSSVTWHMAQNPKGNIGDLLLLSSSFDFTVTLFRADVETEAWQVDSTLGALVGNKHAYFGAIFLQDQDNILAYTYGGAMHQWERKDDIWKPTLTVKGHFAPVSDLDWDQHDLSLISTSADQTTRIFAEYKNKNWYEMGRPQIHGYDMNTMTCVRTNDKQACKILSGGDEKVLRLFEAPYNYIKTINHLSPHQPDLQFSLEQPNELVEQSIESEAKKQPLGLMNKAPTILLANKNLRVNEEEEGGAGEDFDPMTVLSNVTKQKEVIVVKEPPVEDTLMVRTLWPEQQKLYGHVFEVFCVASTHKGDVAASACKSKEQKYADIIVWDLTKAQTTVPSCRLVCHKLTVVQLEFSKCDQFLLSCSRDRMWALFKRSSGAQFSLIRKLKDAHQRIIWGVSFSHDDALFATASREKQQAVKVWHGVKEEKYAEELHSELPKNQVDSATAVRFFPQKVNEKYTLLVGREIGEISVWAFDENAWSKQFQIP